MGTRRFFKDLIMSFAGIIKNVTFHQGRLASFTTPNPPPPPVWLLLKHFPPLQILNVSLTLLTIHGPSYRQEVLGTMTPLTNTWPSLHLCLTISPKPPRLIHSNRFISIEIIQFNRHSNQLPADVLQQSQKSLLL